MTLEGALALIFATAAFAAIVTQAAARGLRPALTRAAG